MLTFLTGDIQTGKTTWLLRRIDELEGEGVEVCGVVAPGVWVDHGESPGEDPDETPGEGTGDPPGESPGERPGEAPGEHPGEGPGKRPCERPGDNTSRSRGCERFEKTGIDNLLLPERRVVPFARRVDLAQSAGSFDEGSQAARAGLRWAIDEVAIEKVNAHFDRLGSIEQPGRRLLVVDEFGILELERGGGLSSAVALIDRGATPAFPDALVVVRSGLLERARERFAHAAWGGVRILEGGSTASSI